MPAAHASSGRRVKSGRASASGRGDRLHPSGPVRRGRHRGIARRGLGCGRRAAGATNAQQRSDQYEQRCERRGMALVETIEGLLSVERLLLREVKLALVEEGQRSRRRLARLLEALRANDERGLDEFGWRSGIVRCVGDAYEARAQGLDAEALADVVEVLVLVGRAVEGFLE